MRVVTKNPVIYQDYSYAFGDKFKEFVAKQKDKRAEKKSSGQPTFFDKAKGLVGGMGNKGAQTDTQNINNQTSTPNVSAQTTIDKGDEQGFKKDNAKKTIKTIAIVVGGALILGLIVFVATRPKK